VSLHEAVRGAARRADSSPWPFVIGEIVSYDPATHFVVAQYDVTDRDGTTTPTQTPPSQLMVPWWGANYGDQSGPEQGAQCAIAILDPEGSEFLILGFTSNDLNPGFGTPSGEKQILDKRGSFVWWTAIRGGALRIFGKGFATLFGTNGTEIGGENLDATEDAICTKRYVDDVISRQMAQLKTDLATWAGAHLQSGSGASGPTSLTAETTNASSKARAVP
jgi:hypothetical protein